MLGVILTFLSTGLTEFSDTVGKKEAQEKVISFATFGFLNLLLGTIILVAIGLWRDSFVFSTASLPTFLARFILEILLVHLTAVSIIKVDRSDFTFVKALTVPFLLVVDIALGYAISTTQIIGILIILFAIFLLLSKEHFHTKGLKYVLPSALIAVATISIFKYDISNFNSVEAEQVPVMLGQMIYLLVLALVVYKENPFKFLKKPIFIGQTTAAGLSSTLASYAYLFGPAAVITISLRAFSILFSLISGRVFFNEKHIAVKIISFGFIIVGLYLLV
jgi:drug/metabolite transporter (DMT)-like permease